MGVTLYCLVHGRAPFDHADILQLSHSIIHEEFRVHHHLSSELKELLSLMLNKDPRERITIPEIKVHPWVTKRGENPMLSTEENCIYEEVTEEECQNALSPAVTFVSKMMDKFKKHMAPRKSVAESEERLTKHRSPSLQHA